MEERVGERKLGGDQIIFKKKPEQRLEDNFCKYSEHFGMISFCAIIVFGVKKKKKTKKRGKTERRRVPA
jgi:hypothetical protein